MAASNNSTNDTLLAEFFMDDFNRMVRQEKRALQARNNTTDSQPNTAEKVAEKAPFDHAAFLAWAKKGPTKQEESPLEKRPYDHTAFLTWAKGPTKQEEDTSIHNISNSSSFRLRTF
jgi:hypothetical protein